MHRAALIALIAFSVSACSDSTVVADEPVAEHNVQLAPGMTFDAAANMLGQPSAYTPVDGGSLAQFDVTSEAGEVNSLVVAFDPASRVVAWMSAAEFEAMLVEQTAAQAQALDLSELDWDDLAALAALGYADDAAYGYAGGSSGYGYGYGYGGDESAYGYGGALGFNADPNVDYGDPTNPDSYAFDQFEYDSQGWSGGAYDNPSSSYYDASSDMSYTPSFDSYGY